MNTFVGKVILHNGHYDREFGVRVQASNFRVAVMRAVYQAQDKLKPLLAPTKKRMHIERISVHLTRLKEIKVEDDNEQAR